MSSAAAHPGLAPSRPRRRNSTRGIFLRLATFASLLLIGFANPVQAQTVPPVIAVSDTVMEIRLKEGSVLFGRIVAVDGDRVTIQLESGSRIDVERPQIVSIRRTSSRMVRGERWEEDPNSTRLFFGPTGRPLGRGTGYFAVYELIMPFLSYGITDRISVSGGTPVIPGVTGELLYFAPKITLISRPSVNFSAGALAFSVPSEDESLGLVYGVGTLGSTDHAFTVGAGIPFIVGEEDEIADRAVVMLGAESRVSRRTKMIGESYFVPGESGGIVALGARFFGERLSADAGLGFLFGGDDSSCCVPIVNFVYVFGAQR